MSAQRKTYNTALNRQLAPCLAGAREGFLWDSKSHSALLHCGVVCLQPSLLQILMPPLQEKWASLPDTDRELQPLFECFTSLATALGKP